MNVELNVAPELFGDTVREWVDKETSTDHARGVERFHLAAWRRRAGLLAYRAADRAIRIFGGVGCSAEADALHCWHDARLFRIGPVTDETASDSIAEPNGLPGSF